jgi:hypothetical protein
VLQRSYVKRRWTYYIRLNSHVIEVEADEFTGDACNRSVSGESFYSPSVELELQADKPQRVDVLVQSAEDALRAAQSLLAHSDKEPFAFQCSHNYEGYIDGRHPLPVGDENPEPSRSS